MDLIVYVIVIFSCHRFSNYKQTFCTSRRARTLSSGTELLCNPSLRLRIIDRIGIRTLNARFSIRFRMIFSRGRSLSTLMSICTGTSVLVRIPNIIFQFLFPVVLLVV